MSVSTADRRPAPAAGALTTGGGDETLSPILRRDFPRTWKYRHRNEATLAGVWKLAELAAG